jgi:hypothetical protein
MPVSALRPLQSIWLNREILFGPFCTFDTRLGWGLAQQKVLPRFCRILFDEAILPSVLRVWVALNRTI